METLPLEGLMNTHLFLLPTEEIFSMHNKHVRRDFRIILPRIAVEMVLIPEQKTPRFLGKYFQPVTQSLMFEEFSDWTIYAASASKQFKIDDFRCSITALYRSKKTPRFLGKYFQPVTQNLMFEEFSGRTIYAASGSKQYKIDDF